MLSVLLFISLPFIIMRWYGMSSTSFVDKVDAIKESASPISDKIREIEKIEPSNMDETIYAQEVIYFLKKKVNGILNT